MCVYIHYGMVQLSISVSFLGAVFLLTPSPPSHHHYPHTITTLTPTPPSHHHHHHTITTFTPSPPSHHHHPHTITTLTPLPPSHHHHPYTITTLTPLLPSHYRSSFEGSIALTSSVSGTGDGSFEGNKLAGKMHILPGAIDTYNVCVCTHSVCVCVCVCVCVRVCVCVYACTLTYYHPYTHNHIHICSMTTGDTVNYTVTYTGEDRKSSWRMEIVGSQTGRYVGFAW